MQAVPQISVGWNLSWFVILGAAIFGFVVVTAVVRRSSQSAQVAAKFALLGAVLLAVIVLGTFSVHHMGASSQEIQESRFASRPAEIQPPVTVRPESPPIRSSSSTNESTDSLKAAAEPIKPETQLPEWTQQPSRVDGANTFVVVKSGRFASLEEAELHAFDEAGRVAAQHFRHLDPRGVGQCVPIQRELVRETAIRDRFEEISRHDLGTMKNFPMHQVWLRVELSPQLGERIAEPWRQFAVAARLRTLTGWSVWGTAAAALVAFALRLDSVWNGRRRAAVVGTTVALVLGSLLVVA